MVPTKSLVTSIGLVIGYLGWELVALVTKAVVFSIVLFEVAKFYTA